jgi:hypothetical protein
MGVQFQKTYYKVITSSWRHHDYKYKLGKNILTESFDSRPICNGRLYFCEFEQIHYWFDLYADMKWICKVKLCSDSRVVMIQSKECRKFKTIRLILYDPILIPDFIQ